MAQQHEQQMEQLNRALKSQMKALEELKKDNINLYNMAIQVNRYFIYLVKKKILFSISSFGVSKLLLFFFFLA